MKVQAPLAVTTPEAREGTLAIVLDAAQARSLADTPDDVTAVLALSPLAQAALRDERKLAPDPITDYAHARVAARAERAVRQFTDEIARQNSLRRGTLSLLDFVLRTECYVAARLWETLRPGGPWLIFHNGTWERIEDRDEAHAKLLQQHNKTRELQRPPPLLPIYRVLRRIVLRLIRRRGPWILTRRRDLVFGLVQALEDYQPPFRRLIARTISYGTREYQRLFDSLRDGLSGKDVVHISLISSHDETARLPVERALDAISDPVIARAFSGPLRETVLAEAAHCEGLFDDALAVVGDLQPSSYITRQESGHYAVLAEAAGVANVPRYVINYNSLPASRSAIADSVLSFQLRTRMPQGLSDNYLMWSPNIAALGARIFDAETRALMRPLRLPPPDPKSLKRRPGAPRLLHASNFTEWIFFLPWVMETSDEFVESICSLIEGLAPLPDVDLTIRTKSKGECSPETLERLLPKPAGFKITGTDRPFVEALKDADLLIGFMSTTLEEGVLNRKPVLLWGPTSRYLHLPARSTPPTADDRAAVYVAHRKEDLAPMVRAILDAHLDRPLTDAEIAEHVWPEGTPTVEDLAQELAARAKSTGRQGA